MTTINTELVDITKNIKWFFMGDDNNNNTLIDFAPFERKLVPMKVQWADKVPTRSKKDSLVQITFNKHSDIPLMFSEGAIMATIKELMKDVYMVPIINYSNHSSRVYVKEIPDWLTFKALKYLVKN